MLSTIYHYEILYFDTQIYGINFSELSYISVSDRISDCLNFSYYETLQYCLLWYTNKCHTLYKIVMCPIIEKYNELFHTQCPVIKTTYMLLYFLLYFYTCIFINFNWMLIVQHVDIATILWCNIWCLCHVTYVYIV